MTIEITLRPEPTEYAAWIERYVSKVPNGSIGETLAHQLEETLGLLRRLPAEKTRFAYAPGKWTLAEVVGHFTDSERVFAYRALAFARGETQPLPGFDENVYAAHAAAATRPFDDVIEDYACVRRATLSLLHGLAPEAWSRRGVASEKDVSVRALFWVIAGHERHHLGVLRERYL